MSFQVSGQDILVRIGNADASITANKQDADTKITNLTQTVSNNKTTSDNNESNLQSNINTVAAASHADIVPALKASSAQVVFTDPANNSVGTGSAFAVATGQSVVGIGIQSDTNADGNMAGITAASGITALHVTTTTTADTLFLPTMRNDESATFVLNAPNLAGQQVTLSLTDATNGQQTRVMTLVGTTTVFQWTHDAPATPAADSMATPSRWTVGSSGFDDSANAAGALGAAALPAVAVDGTTLSGTTIPAGTEQVYARMQAPQFESVPQYEGLTAFMRAAASDSDLPPQLSAGTFHAALQFSSLDKTGSNAGDPIILHFPQTAQVDEWSAPVMFTFSLNVDPNSFAADTMIKIAMRNNDGLQLYDGFRPSNWSTVQYPITFQALFQGSIAGHGPSFVAQNARDANGNLVSLTFQSPYGAEYQYQYSEAESTIVQHGTQGGVLSNINIAMPSLAAGHSNNATLTVDVVDANCRAWTTEFFKGYYATTKNFNRLPFVTPMSGGSIISTLSTAKQYAVPQADGQTLRLQFSHTAGGTWELASKIYVDSVESSLTLEYFPPGEPAAYDDGALSTDALSTFDGSSAFTGTGATMPGFATRTGQTLWATCEHVARNSAGKDHTDLRLVLPGGAIVPAAIAGHNYGYDVAFLTTDDQSGVSAVSMEDSWRTTLAMGKDAVILGCPWTDFMSVTSGIIADSGSIPEFLTFNVRYSSRTYMIVDAVSRAGNSGCLVTGKDGTVVGMIAFGPTHQNSELPVDTYSGAVPAWVIRGFLNRLGSLDNYNRTLPEAWAPGITFEKPSVPLTGIRRGVRIKGTSVAIGNSIGGLLAAQHGGATATDYELITITISGTAYNVGYLDGQISPWDLGFLAQGTGFEAVLRNVNDASEITVTGTI